MQISDPWTSESRRTSKIMESIEEGTHQGSEIDDDNIIGTQVPSYGIGTKRANEYQYLVDQGSSSKQDQNLGFRQVPSYTAGTFTNAANQFLHGQSSSSKQWDSIGFNQVPLYTSGSIQGEGHHFLQDQSTSGNHGFNQVVVPSTFEYSTNACTAEGDPNIVLSQGMGMSFTDMLLSVEEPTFSQRFMLNNGGSSMMEPMGAENQTFMITGRNGSSQSMLLDEDGEEEEQPLFVDKDDDLEDYEDAEFGNDEEGDDDAENLYNWQWDGNEQQDDAQVENEDSTQDQNDTTSNKETVHPAAEMVMPDGVEQLTPEDIRLYLEHESVKAARTGSQEVLGHHVPHMNMIFDTEEQAYKFYKEYSLICGFSIKKTGNYKGKNVGTEIGTRRTYTCYKSGKVVAPEVMEDRKMKRQQKAYERKGKPVPEDVKKRRRNVIEITGCKAKMVVTLKETKWHVTNIELHHNHEMCPADQTKFLRTHKDMTTQEKLFIRTFTSVKLATRKIMAILTYLRGGKPKNVPYTKKDVSNVMTAIRQEDNRNDMSKVLDYFRKRKDEDPRFHYEFKLGKGNKVECIFWADGFAREMYDLYGDVVSFDTTFKTNKYNLPFAPFVGVTGHGHNCLFGCAIINNEQGATFEWLFRAFKRCHGGKDPVTIITDQDQGIKKGIDAVFPHICHRNCFFHVKRKAEEKCGGSFGRIPNLHIDFSDILRNSLTIAEFEYLWPLMIQRYNVGHLKYLKIMWENRHRFVPVYFKNNFCPFVHSTARSEGTNSIFKDNVGCTFSVISFMGEYEKISQNTQEQEKEQELVTMTTDPKYCLWTELEMQAGRMYNRKIFYKFQKQIMFAAKLHANEVEKFVSYEVYKTPMLQMQEIRPRKYLVSVNMQTQDFVCICAKFDKDGMVCAHILRVLTSLNMSELPEKYYISRWRPKEKKFLRDSKYSLPVDLSTSNKHLRYSVLSRRMSDVASEGSETIRKYTYVTGEIKKIEERLDEMTLEDIAEENMKRQKGKQPAPSSVPARVDDGYGDFLQDPDVAPSKGRPENSKRQKTFVEELLSKGKITCSHCRSHEHNIATCTNKHLPKENFQKKPTKTNKTSTANAKDQQKSSNQQRKQSKAKDQNKSTSRLKKQTSQTPLL